MKKSRHGSHLEAPAEDAARGAHSVPPPDGWFSRVWSALKLGTGVLFVVALSLAVAWGAHRYALTTPRFAISKLSVDGSRRMSDEQVARLAGIRVGNNIFATDLAAAEKRVLEDPWVKSVRITRQLPNTLKIELSEREVGALAVIGEHTYLVTRSGEPFKELTGSDPFDLPVITGISADELARDRKREIERLGIAMEILRHWDRIGVSKTYPAQEVNLSAGGDATLTAGKRGITLHLGQGPWRKKLLMAERVIGRLSRKGQVPGIVFLDNRAHPERVVVRMR